MMSRRRLPSRRRQRPDRPSEVAARSDDYRYLETVIENRFPKNEAITYLRRHMANQVTIRMVEAKRGESVDVVRAIEVIHANGRDRSSITSTRLLQNGQEASFFMPDHLVTVRAKIDGAAKNSQSLEMADVVVLHVPVRGFMRYLPGIFHGEGPISTGDGREPDGVAMQQWASGIEEQVYRDLSHDEAPIQRFLFVFQHILSTINVQIDNMSQLTNPMQCDPELLPWLASWVGFDLDRALPLYQQRELVRRATRLFRTRGTKRGMEEMLRILTSAPTRVLERKRPAGMVVGRGHLSGGKDLVERYERNERHGCYLFEVNARAETSFFMLQLEPRKRFKQRFGERAQGTLRRIVDVLNRERPSHVLFTVSFEESR
jgi:phage tail-like protein